MAYSQKSNRLSRVYAVSVRLLLLSVCALLIASHVGADDGQDLDKVDWWKKTNFYYIYVRSFMDSDGDGEGDLRGISSKLPQLKQMGVETIILSPFYKSPMKDGGYDIQDHLDIRQQFGTMADFEALVQEVKSHKMRIVIDFVPNRTSKEHEWFKCSERALKEPDRCGKYKDYYVWSSSKRHEGKYPSNWISKSSGEPAWTWSETREQFYLHQFSSEQPDLDFTNPDVREEFKAIARSWLSKGVDGLRVSDIDFLFVDKDLTDKPENPNWKQGDNPWRRLLHINILTGREAAKVVGEWRQLCKDEFPRDKKVIITEAHDDIPKLLEFYGNDYKDRFADLSVNTELFKLREDNLKPDYIEELALSWIKPMLKLGWPSEQGAMSPWILWTIGNQDITRVVHRVGEKNVFFLRLLAYMLPGVPVNYYGDELPLKDASLSSVPQKTLDEGDPSRLLSRAPMLWTNRVGTAGFSSNGDIWMPLNEDSQVNNFAHLYSSFSNPYNDLKLFIILQALRKNHLGLFVFGDLVFFHNEGEDANKLLAVARTHEKFGNLLMLTNLSPKEKIQVRLRSSFSVIKGELVQPPQEAVVEYLNMKVNHLNGQTGLVQIDSLSLNPSETIVLSYSGTGERRQEEKPSLLRGWKRKAVEKLSDRTSRTYH